MATRLGRHRARAAGLAAAVLACAALAGIAPAVLSGAGMIALVGATALVLGALVTYRLLGGGPRRLATPAGEIAIEAPAAALPAETDGAAIRLGRGLFYVGALSVTQDSLVLAAGLTLSELAFIASFICCVGAVLAGSAVARVPALLVFGAVTYVLGGLISSLASEGVLESTASVGRAAYVMLFWAWTAAMVLRTREQVLRALVLWAVSAAISGLGAIGDIAGVVEGKSSSRATGFSTHANELGGACAVAFVPALMLAVVRDRGRARLALGACAGLAMAGVVLSGSVAAMAAAALALIIWLSAPAVQGFGRIAVAIAVIAAFAVASVAGGVTPPGERLSQVTASSPSTPQEGSGSYRVAMWKVAWPEIADDPFVGKGLSNDERAISFVEGSRTYVAHVHGAPVAAWYETGILGLLGLVLVFGGLVHAGWRLAAGAAPEDQLVGWAIAAAFAAFAVIASAGPLYFQGYGWLAAAILAAWWAVAAGREPGLDRLAR